MKKIAMTLLTFAIAVPLTFAADAPKDSNAPAKDPAKTKKHKKHKKTTGAPTTPNATPAK